MIDKDKNCYMYILDGLADWEIGYLTAELKSKRFLSENNNLNFKFISKTLNPIKTMGGTIIEPDIEISKINFKEGDLLILPGSDNWQKIDDNCLISRLKDFINKKINVAAICGATIFLAQLGILNNQKHTSNDLNYLEMICTDYTGSAFYSTNSVVVNNNLITASWLAPLEFTYEILKKLDVMNKETLEAWYNLYSLKDSKYFLQLMESLDSK
ncbi:MAG: DJ-1/PfpI family protein [Spirochaetaceae bacterium]